MWTLQNQVGDLAVPPKLGVRARPCVPLAAEEDTDAAKPRRLFQGTLAQDNQIVRRTTIDLRDVALFDVRYTLHLLRSYIL